MNTAFIGIDPGFSGGISMIMGDEWQSERYPRDREVNKAKQIFNSYWHEALIEGYNVVTYMEKVWAMPHDGRSSAFKFGMNYGIWQGIIAGYELQLVTPKMWQSHYGELSKDKKERKQQLKELAISLVDGQLKPTLNTADAILIANYGKEKYGS
tara:strand:- start:874 stop:1335 length:462 start_codon:yes stop_codon:yes gene_type:complete